MTTEPDSTVRKPLFIKQIVENACGTMALLHSVANVADAIGGATAFPDGSFLNRLAAMATGGSTPEELGNFLNEDEELEQVHGHFSTQG